MIEEYLTRQHMRMAQGQHTIWPIIDIQHGNRHEAIALADLSANGMLWMGLFGLLLVMSQLLTFLTGWEDPYITRTNESLLKWKYAHMNSVDFKFQVHL